MCCQMLSHVWLFTTPVDCSPQGSSVYEILQARILQWVVIPFSRVSSQPRDWTLVSCIVGRFFFFLILFLNFTILFWFCHISKWILHRYTCVPHPEPSSLLPPHTIPLGRPSAPAPSIQILYCLSYQGHSQFIIVLTYSGTQVFPKLYILIPFKLASAVSF